MHQAGLYFPFIHVRDDDWLKLATLYWPAVYRLVPSGYFTHDSRTAREFIDAGLLRDEDPREVLTSMTHQLIDTLRSNILPLASRYSIAQADERFDGRKWSDASGDSNHRPALAWIHVTKFWPELVEELVAAGLAEVGRPSMGAQHRHGPPEAWVGMHPLLGAAYITALATEISTAREFQPLTDQPDLRIAAPADDIGSVVQLLVGRDPGREAKRPDQPVAVDEYVMFALQCVRPRNISRLSAEQIIRCRENLAGELADFRQYVADQQQTLAEIASIPPGKRKLDAFADHVRDTVEAPLQQLERGLQLHKMDTVRTMLVTGTLAPPLASLGLERLGAGGTVGLSVGTVAAMGAAWWQVRAAREAARARSPLSYLLDVRDELTPKTIAGRFQRIVKGSY